MKITEITPHLTALEEMGRRLKMMRKAQGLSGQALAAASGVSTATLSRMEGGTDSQLSSWIKAISALGFSGSLDQLLPEEYDSPMVAVRGPSKRRTPKEKSSGPNWKNKHQ